MLKKQQGGQVNVPYLVIVLWDVILTILWILREIGGLPEMNDRFINWLDAFFSEVGIQAIKTVI